MRSFGKKPNPKPDRAAADKLISELVATLIEARKDHGWSQERLSEELELSVETVKAIEIRRRSPSLKTLVLIARKLGLKLTLQ